MLGTEHPETLRAREQSGRPLFRATRLGPRRRVLARSTAAIARRERRGAQASSQGLTGKRKSETERSGPQFWGLVKASTVLRSKTTRGVNAAREIFETAQWALSSEAAASLSQMAARGAKGTPSSRRSCANARTWSRNGKSGISSATGFGQAPEQRDAKAEAEQRRLAAIDTRIAEIDKALAAEFPDYTALARPTPLTVEEVQALLGAGRSADPLPRYAGIEANP